MSCSDDMCSLVRGIYARASGTYARAMQAQGRARSDAGRCTTDGMVLARVARTQFHPSPEHLLMPPLGPVPLGATLTWHHIHLEQGDDVRMVHLSHRQLLGHRGHGWGESLTDAD